MQRDNIKFTKEVINDFYLKYSDAIDEVLARAKERKHGDCKTLEKDDNKYISIDIGKDIQVKENEKLSDVVISKIYEINESLNGNIKEVNSIISEIMVKYSLERLGEQLYVGMKPASLERLSLDNTSVRFTLMESRNDRKIRKNVDFLLADSGYDKRILTIQETLDDNYISITTIYTPKTNKLQKNVRVWDKNATNELANKNSSHGILYPDLCRQIEVIKTEKGIQLYDYEVLDKEFKEKNCVAFYEMETDRSMNEVAAIYVKQLELEKMVEDKIDFKQYQKKIPTKK